MERYFPVISRQSSTCNEQERKKKRESAKYQPYAPSRPLKNQASEDDLKEGRAKRVELSAVAASKLVAGTLKDGINPITNSDISQRTDYVNSMSTGHQVGDVNRGHRSYMKLRDHKLKTQRKASEEGETVSDIMRFVRIYIDGYLEETTDIEMKRLITKAGGQVTGSPSACTHIVTSMLLNGSKTQRFLTTKSKNKVHIVKPEWVMDSIDGGKRKPEREYAIVKTANSRTMTSMLKTL